MESHPCVIVCEPRTCEEACYAECRRCGTRLCVVLRFR